MTETALGVPRPGHLRGGRAAAPVPGGARAGVGGARAAATLAGERGAVTAEYAVLLPAIVLVLVAVVLAGAASVQQVRNADAAAASARILARGDSEADARDAVARMAGRDARLEHADDGGWVTVTVSHPGPGPLGWLEPITLQTRASAPVQHGDPGEAS